MMIRKIVEIQEEKCNGCGLCASACHEGAIAMVNGKAKLIKDDYCDGLGDCLPACPTGAITIVEREAAAYDEAAVKRRMAEQRTGNETNFGHIGRCPGAAGRMLREEETIHTSAGVPGGQQSSQLRQWPVQIQLVPVHAPFFQHAELLIAADCTAFSYGEIHRAFMQGRVTLIGCPKLDPVDYADKLTEIFAENIISGITVLRMEVPCCGGLTHAVQQALAACGKEIPYREVAISIKGEILNQQEC